MNKVGIWCFLASYLVLMLVRINSIGTVVADEPVYVGTVQELMSGKIGSNNHPLLAKSINAIVVLGFYVVTGTDKPIYWRLTTIMFSLGCVYMVYLILKKMTDQKYSLLALGLLVLDPLFFSFSRILNLDIVSLFFGLVGFYKLWEYKIGHNNRNYWWASLFIGLSLAAKLNLIGVALIIPLLEWTERRKIYCFKWYLGVGFGFILGSGAFFIFGINIPFWKYIGDLVLAQVNLHEVYGTQVSPAWTWMIVPQILILFRIANKVTVSTVVSVISPIWQALSLPIVGYLGYKWLNSRKSRQFLNLWGIFFWGQYAPLLFVTRPTYSYYMIQLIPYMLIALAVMAYQLKSRYVILGGYLVAAITIFVLYYPILVGIPISLLHEKWLISYNQYKYPVINNLFCQSCWPR